LLVREDVGCSWKMVAVLGCDLVDATQRAGVSVSIALL
jgi:hypothetical protein